MPDMAAGLMALGAVLCCVSVMVGFASVEEDSRKGAAVAMIGLALSILMIVSGATAPRIPTIKVVLSPTVDMVELMSRYEVQSIDGQIWELVEKERTQ